MNVDGSTGVRTYLFHKSIWYQNLSQTKIYQLLHSWISDLQVTLIFQCYPHTSLLVLLSHDPQALLLQHWALHIMQTTHFSVRIGVTQNHHTGWNGSHLFGNLPVLEDGRLQDGRGAAGTDLSRTYPLEPADVVFNPCFPWGSLNQKYIRDENHQFSPQ